MQMMTAVGKIKETKLLQDKHTFQFTVKINSLLVKIGYGTASFTLSLSLESHTYTQNTYTHLFTFIPRMALSPGAHGHYIKTLYCIDVEASEPIKSYAYTMPISTEI